MDMAAMRQSIQRVAFHRSTVVDGVKTTLPLHYWITEQDAFTSGEYNIHWLEKMLGERA